MFLESESAALKAFCLREQDSQNCEGRIPSAPFRCLVVAFRTLEKTILVPEVPQFGVIPSRNCVKLFTEGVLQTRELGPFLG